VPPENRALRGRKAPLLLVFAALALACESASENAPAPEAKPSEIQSPPAPEQAAQRPTSTKDGAAAEIPSTPKLDKPANRPSAEPIEEAEVEEADEAQAGGRGKGEKNRHADPLDDAATRAPSGGTAAPSVTPTKKTTERTGTADPNTLLAELDRLERRLDASGIAITRQADGAIAASDLDRNASLRLSETACTEVCTVTESICTLSTRICDLAEGHQGDDRYARACTRAKTDCSVGTAACDACRE
jgi:hypothetical protein